MSSAVASLRALLDLGRAAAGLLRWRAAAPPDPEATALDARADEARRAGRVEEARTLYERALAHQRHDLAALRGLRDLAVASGRWLDALDLGQRALAVAPPADRAREAEWLAVIHYELGRADLACDRAAAAAGHFKSALRAHRPFVPAALALGEAYERTGDRREAVRAWERAIEAEPALPILARLERAYREDGRPSRMIAVYRAALDRAPEDQALALALGRVYFELEMLDEAADQFEKIEVRNPDLAVVHAFLGAVFERRGETGEAFAEYRRALTLADAFDWPQRCRACGAAAARWQDRCPACGAWNALGAS